MKVLVATDKPFAKVAVDGIRKEVESAGFELVLLEKYTEKKQLLDAVANVDAIIVRSDIVDAEVIGAAKNLKIVVRAGAGYDNVDLEAATKAGVVVMNTPGQNSNAVAELALGMMIFMARNQFTPATGTELKGKRLGIHAYGNIGRLIGQMGKALGMTVSVFRPTSTDTSYAAKDGVNAVTSAEELYKNSDYVSIHIPANEKTKNSIGYQLLNSMPKGATLINTARKEVINEAELVKLMEERTDFKYATDIMPSNHEEMLQKFQLRYFATPKKMGAQTAEANINAGIAAAKQIVDFIKNGNAEFKVN